MRRGAWGVVVSIVAIAACGNDEPSATSTPPASIAPMTAPETTAPETTAPETTLLAVPATIVPLTALPVAVDGLDGNWVAVSGSVDGSPVELIDANPITLTVAGDLVTGTAACNSYEYEVERSARTITFMTGFKTDTGCSPPDVMELEAVYMASIGPVADFTVDATTLTLTTPSAVWTFERVAPASEPDLIGTVWQLDALFGEFGASHTVGMETGNLVLAPDGSLAGSTSCRDIAGTWAQNGSDLVLRTQASIGTCSTSLADVDAAVLDVLNSGAVSFEIDSGQLTLMASDGAGVGYRQATTAG